MDALEPRCLLYAVGVDGGEQVHEWITEQAHNLFLDQFGWSYITQPSSLASLRQGARDEDVPSGAVLGHFWDEGLFGRTLGFGGGLFLAEAPPTRAVRYFGEMSSSPLLSDTDTLVRIGRVAHLLQDVTVPSHAHNDAHLDRSAGDWLENNGFDRTAGDWFHDPDPFHDWVDGLPFVRNRSSVDPLPNAAFDSAGTMYDRSDRRVLFYRQGQIDSATLRRPDSIPTPLTAGSDPLNYMVGLFYENAETADDFDSKDFNGEGPRAAGGSGGHRYHTIIYDVLGIEFPYEESGYEAWTISELNAQANVLVPLAVRSTAEWFRVFFSDPRINDEDPIVDFIKLNSTDESQPQRLPNTTVYLDAIATDEELGNAGVGKDTFEFEYRRRTADGSGAWSEWQTVPSSQSARGRHVENGSSVAPDLSEFAGKHSATIQRTFEAESGFIYSLRVKNRDGGGREGMSEEYFVRVGAGASVVEVIDRSGSMSGSPLTAAKSAAQLFADLLRPRDRIGVVAFDSSASVVFSLTDIDDGLTIINSAKAAIASIVSSGNTAIGEGIFVADSLLDQYAGEPGRAIVLMSDGQNNAGRDPLSVIRQYVEPGVRIFSIGFGSGADGTTLSAIAAATGGEYYYAASNADLQQIYTRILGPLSGQTSVTNQNLTISPGQSRSQSVNIPGGRSATFGVNWGGSDLDLSLTDPSGRTYAPIRTTVFSSTLDTLDGWTAEGAAWTVIEDAALGGTAVTESPTGNYSNRMDARLTLATALRVPAGGELRLRHRYHFESGYDKGDVEVSTDLLTWNRVARFTGTRTAATEDAVSLADYAGQDVYLRLRVTSDGSVTYDGWLIDSLSVEGIRYPDGVEYTTTGTYEIYRVTNPMPGEWTMTVMGVDVPRNDYPFNIYAFNDDRPPLPPRLSISDTSVTESPTGVRAAEFAVTLSSAWSTAVSVRYRVEGISALAGEDFDQIEGVLIIPAGSLSGTISVNVRGDLRNEGPETFRVVMLEPTECTIDVSEAVGTIEDLNVREVAFGGKVKGAYTDQAGKAVTVSLSGGTGVLVYLGESQTPFAIRVDASTPNSALGVASKTPTSLGLIQSRTPLKSVTAKGVTFTSGLDLSGGCGAVMFADLWDGARLDLGRWGKSKVTAGALRGGRVFSDADSLALQAASWVGEGGALTARAIDSLKVLGDCSADLFASAGAKSVSVSGAWRDAEIRMRGNVGTVTAGSLRAIDLAIAGVVKTLKAGDTTNSQINLWNSGTTSMTLGRVTDSDVRSNNEIKALSVVSWVGAGASDRVLAPSIKSVVSKGDFGASLGVAGRIGTVKIAGALRDAVWRIGDGIGTLAAARLIGTRVFAGAATYVSSLPETPQALPSTSAFITTLSITSGIADSLVSAPLIGTAKIGRVDATGAGISGRTIKSIKATGAGGETISATSLLRPDQSFDSGLLRVRVIAG